jgi:hypothetical protein
MIITARPTAISLSQKALTRQSGLMAGEQFSLSARTADCGPPTKHFLAQAAGQHNA